MFGTSGVRGPVGDTVTAALALDVGRALGAEHDRVVVGRDVRDSGRALVDAMAAGLMESGADVVDVGVQTTPTIARAVSARDAGAGVAVTASHNPPEDNGIKLWTPSGQAFDADERATIERRIENAEYDLASWDDHGDRRNWPDAATHHREALLSVGRADAERHGVDLSSLSITVDVGNGPGRVTADALHELGASVETLNATRDGRFPGRPSEPTAETCTSLAAHVEATDADLGIAHDGDADRTMAVGDDGTFVPKDVLFAMFAREEASAGDRVAAPVDTSLVVDDALADVGASVTRTRVGDVYVAERTRESGVVFGGEPSGAWIFPSETRCPDGPLAAVKLAVLAAATPLSERVAALDQHPIRRASVETEARSAVVDEVSRIVGEEYEEITAVDGVRIELDDGWMLVRASGTQPLVRITAEARRPEAADAILEDARSIVDRATTAVED